MGVGACRASGVGHYSQGTFTFVSKLPLPHEHPQLSLTERCSCRDERVGR